MPRFIITGHRTRVVTERSMDITLDAETADAARETMETLDRDGHLIWHMLFNDPASGAHEYTVVKESE